MEIGLYDRRQVFPKVEIGLYDRRHVFPKVESKFEDFKYDAKEEIRFTDLPNDIRKRKNHFYVILVLIRHLVIGTFILWYSITKWLFGANKLEQISQITFILIPILILFCIVYALHRKTFKQIKEGINNILQSN